MAHLYIGNPNNYLSLLRNLVPGDTLLLEPGNYDNLNDVPGLPFINIHGEDANPIVVSGTNPEKRPLFLGRSTHNTVRFSNASYIEIRNIAIDGRDLGGDGIKGQGVSHHITLENILIKGVGSDQQIVGISTKAPAWNWIVRNCIIIEAGTGMYFGNSDGTMPFVNGLIEYNLILNTIGYNLQIKHQIDRPDAEGMPRAGTTIIRHNVFSKAANGSIGSNARPNLLVGHWPLSGDGAEDVYQIYGNFFYQNPTGEALFQGEGNIALYNNLFVNHDGDAIWIQPHNDVPKMIRIFNNTIVASGTGIRVTGSDSNFMQKVIGNAVFATNQIVASDQNDNITDAYANAENFLSNPFGSPTNTQNYIDLFPLVGKLSGQAIDSSFFQIFADWDRDFNGNIQDGTFRGAYAGEGQNPGWLPKLEVKPKIDDDMPVSVREQRIKPSGFLLLQNYPNPFNPNTTIRFKVSSSSVDKTTKVRLDIFNLMGERVRTLVDSIMKPGIYEISWRGVDDKGQMLSSGVYIFQLKTNRLIASRKLLLLR